MIVDDNNVFDKIVLELPRDDIKIEDFVEEAYKLFNNKSVFIVVTTIWIYDDKLCLNIPIELPLLINGEKTNYKRYVRDAGEIIKKVSPIYNRQVNSSDLSLRDTYSELASEYLLIIAIRELEEKQSKTYPRDKVINNPRGNALTKRLVKKVKNRDSTNGYQFKIEKKEV